MPGKFIIDELYDDNDTFVCNMKCDVYYKDNNYYIIIDTPGYEKGDLIVEYANGYLSVTGKRELKNNDESIKYLRRERSYGTYKRQFYVGEINTNKIEAKYINGVLNIVVPKMKEESSKMIQIK